MNEIENKFGHTREEILKDEKLDLTLVKKKPDVSQNAQKNCSKYLLKEVISQKERKIRR